MKVQRAIDNFGQIDRAFAGRGRPRKISQVLDNLRRPPRLLLQHHQLPARGFVGLVILQQFAYAQNAGQRIIQLVSHAANHLSHSGEALALHHLLLQFLFHRNVAHGDDHAT